MVFTPQIHINAQLLGRIAAIEEDLARHKVVGHHDRRCADLGDIGLKGQPGVEPEDDAVVEQKADDGEYQEDHELALAAHALLVLKYVLHAGQIVEDHRDDKARRVGDDNVHAQAVVQDVHDAKVDDGGDDAHDAELHDLCDKVLQNLLPNGWRATLRRVFKR